MIARPRISQNEWKAAEKGGFEVGNFALFCYPALHDQHGPAGAERGLRGREGVRRALRRRRVAAEERRRARHEARGHARARRGLQRAAVGADARLDAKRGAAVAAGAHAPGL